MSFEALLTANFKTPPWHHQLREFEISADEEVRALLWQMRTGKTKIIIDTACHLYLAGKIDVLIIFAPNGIHENWIVRELPTHAWTNVNTIALAWQTRVAGLKYGASLSVAMKALWEAAHLKWWDEFKRMSTTTALAVVAFNSEAMTRKDIRKAVAKLLTKRRCMVVWDESSDFRTPGSARTLMSRAITKHAPFRRILDGTVVTNSPLHSFSQYELLRPGALGFTRFEDFKDRYAIYELARRPGGGAYPALKEYQHLDELRERMSTMSSVVLRSDCEDLPAVVPFTRDIGLTDEQVRLYKEVQAKIKIELAKGLIVSIGQRTAKLGKLQQIVSGFLIDEQQKVHDIRGGNPRLEALSDEVYLAPGKVIVFCQFQEDLDRASKRLRADGWDVLEYHGRVSAADKAKARKAFGPDAPPDKAVIVGQWASMSRGIELSGADTIIAYSHTFNAIFRQQGIERATKMGGGNVRLIDFMAPGVDHYMVDRVASNVAVADDLAGNGMKWLQESMI